MPVVVDIGGTTIRLAETSPEGSIPSEVITIDTPDSIEATVALIIDHIEALGPSGGIGVGCAGVVDHPSGMWRWMPHAAGRNVPIGMRLRDRFDVPVVVDNDVNLACLAESTVGAGVGARMVLMVALGTGIGGAVCIDGVVERGSGSLGEIGHMRLADGPACACGSAGCWEALVSGRVLDAAARSLLGDDARGPELVTAASRGDAACATSLADAGRWLGIGLGNLILALAPDVVVLGGGVMQPGDELLAAARMYLSTANGALSQVPLPPLRRASFGTLAGLVGAGRALEATTR